MSENISFGMEGDTYFPLSIDLSVVMPIAICVGYVYIIF